ncbi:SAM-dependent methyltransferase [Solwaraspora sp. WMMD406]|uniref:SAM-dependent methyltransferase n=1 Tax=Solwaraspora sp. WMMD406 TaxID=3016095 RepID=UPI00241747F2|nr:SAM-dependent methyltransferase [Solwaraspora sp. WMMD406]MDG4768373.1 SAM-dependent methyltransferase [Solwaraspora sp. WMMD406]
MVDHDGALSSRLDTSVPHPARRYNYWLGGKDNFAVDRASADQIAAAWPSAPIAARENRRFLGRATRFLAGEVGIRQFLDIGTGLPTADNTHEIAQAIAPESRVVYVDNDPMVMVHARALLTSTPQGRTSYIEADLREPGEILHHPDLLATLDLSRPVGLMLVAVLHFLPGAGAAAPVVAELVDALPSGSYLAVTNATKDFLPAPIAAVYDKMLAAGQTDIWPRDRAEFAALFEGLDLVPPGIVPVSDWRTDDEPRPRPGASDVSMYGAVARIP